ncbi:putative Ribose/xylose/arabinose/galactoside ABC-type transport systems, permease component [Vibrio nigripulchritudo SO65]|nr:ABC transporter permease [Vibrio nigripulchritudo]CCN36427.1 putative Ribose/xylose/arabinose/galactoside ABC-type transport systems, permease component [Vibrio nigripulchritudo AM115]CCN40717.1 putative Ribose/xylose/arabinose/galactoside ABC-type transport systems, permease component [Vibrio nigripulchritudo FTn2]CCN64476.1 putative Ribose/xylose/arabinose/galactoside ABC-type transport systems, permease component [Vibrio nigripulchritudo POn4]CCN77417.1 putative Ribose/xylose/arabinose/ga
MSRTKVMLSGRQEKEPGKNMWKSLKGTGKLSAYFPLITLLILVLLVSLYDSNFVRIQNLLQLTQDISTLFVMALGMTFVIYIGGIDLSSQSVASMTTVIVTLLLPTLGVGAALAAVVVGALFGLISGWVHVRFRIASFIATLAIGGIAYSTGQVVSGQRSGYMDAAARNDSFGWIVGNTAGIPHEILVAAALLIICLVIEKRTILGRSFKAVGAGELAAVASGLRVNRIKIAAFALSGALAAFAGVMLAARLSGGSPTMADQFLLPALVAVLIGGTPLTGGVGGVLNTLVGAMIVAVVRTSMTYLHVPAQAQQIFFGLVLIVAIALTIDRSKIDVLK